MYNEEEEQEEQGELKRKKNNTKRMGFVSLFYVHVVTTNFLGCSLIVVHPFRFSHQGLSSSGVPINPGLAALWDAEIRKRQQRGEQFSFQPAGAHGEHDEGVTITHT